MSKAFVGGCAFIFGIVFASSFNHTSPAFVANAATGQIISGITFDGNGLTKQIVDIDAAYIPSVRPLPPGQFANDIGFKNSPQQLDGLSCNKCKFDNTQLSYGGGAFELNDLNVSNSTSLTLTGAAANTVRLLNLMNMIQSGKVSPLSNNGTTEKRKAKTPNTLHFPKFSSTSENLIGGTK